MAAGRSRLVCAVRAVWGGVLLLGPAAVLRAGGLGVVTPRAVAVARVLGARHVAQAALTTLAPEAAVPGAVVDSVHAAGNVAVAAVSSRWRRPALLDAAVAAAFAAASGAARPRKDTA